MFDIMGVGDAYEEQARKAANIIGWGVGIGSVSAAVTGYLTFRGTQHVGTTIAATAATGISALAIAYVYAKFTLRPTTTT